MPTRTANTPRPAAPTGVIEIDVAEAHAHSSNHREALLQSPRCGCFYCRSIFSPHVIKEWIGETTARCPACGIDAVLGGASGYPIETWFLARMQERWFG